MDDLFARYQAALRAGHQLAADGKYREALAQYEAAARVAGDRALPQIGIGGAKGNRLQPPPCPPAHLATDMARTDHARGDDPGAQQDETRLGVAGAKGAKLLQSLDQFQRGARGVESAVKLQ